MAEQYVYVVVEQEYGEIYTSVFMTEQAAVDYAKSVDDVGSFVQVRKTVVDAAIVYDKVSFLN